MVVGVVILAVVCWGDEGDVGGVGMKKRLSTGGPVIDDAGAGRGRGLGEDLAPPRCTGPRGTALTPRKCRAPSCRFALATRVTLRGTCTRGLRRHNPIRCLIHVDYLVSVKRDIESSDQTMPLETQDYLPT